ncbi:hypothetical protein [Streptomyces sp. IMTB 2501]|uniref:hypothetical protein n=1 Tax=Streptomyces sp. IMTB 2501 TaxID=1776340 RepID=UPI00117EC47C|nr:hypothetical protein [Streptomyces sp. IMTB 2501]
MHQVAARLDVLDPEAGAATRVIGRFDELIEGCASLGATITAVAALTGSPARLVDARSPSPCARTTTAGPSGMPVPPIRSDLPRHPYRAAGPRSGWSRPARTPRWRRWS